MLHPPSPYQLRAMKSRDVDAVQAIERDSFPTVRPTAYYTNELSNGRVAFYQVLLAAEQLIGYSGYWYLQDEVHINTLAVLPAQRGYGLGRLLLLNLLLQALTHEPRQIRLEVRRRNTVAQRLYHSLRFDVIGRRPGYYWDTGEDAVLMAVTLAGEPGGYPTGPEALDPVAYGRWLARQAAQLFDRLAVRPAAPHVV